MTHGSRGRALFHSPLGYERVLPEADVGQYATTVRIRLRPTV
jgi:hypothetical protein